MLSFCLYIFVHLNIIFNNFFKKEISIQICKLGNAMNANEACHWMLMRKCLLAMLILMLLNLNTGYTDTDADLCIRIMSLCCMCDFEINAKVFFFFLLVENVSKYVQLTIIECKLDGFPVIGVQTVHKWIESAITFKMH